MVVTPQYHQNNSQTLSGFNGSQTGVRTCERVLRETRHDVDLREISADAKYCREVDKTVSKVSNFDKNVIFTSYLAR